MITMFRLTSAESEKVRNIAIEVNKKRIENDIEPVKDSELLHEILEVAFNNITITNKGKIILDIWLKGGLIVIKFIKKSQIWDSGTPLDSGVRCSCSR